MVCGFGGNFYNTGVLQSQYTLLCKGVFNGQIIIIVKILPFASMINRII